MDIAKLQLDDDSIIELLLRQHVEAMESDSDSTDSPPSSQQSSSNTVEGARPIASYLGQLLVGATGPTWGPDTNENGFRDSQLAFRRRLEARVKQLMPQSLGSKFDTEDILQSALTNLIRAHATNSNLLGPDAPMNQVRGVVYKQVEWKMLNRTRDHHTQERDVSRESSSDEGRPTHASDRGRLAEYEVVQLMRDILQQTNDKTEPLFDDRVRQVLVLSIMGKDEDEIAEILSVSPRTIRRDKVTINDAFERYKKEV